VEERLTDSLLSLPQKKIFLSKQNERKIFSCQFIIKTHNSTLLYNLFIKFCLNGEASKAEVNYSEVTVSLTHFVRKIHWNNELISNFKLDKNINLWNIETSLCRQLSDTVSRTRIAAAIQKWQGNQCENDVQFYKK